MHRFSVDGGNIAVWWTGTELKLDRGTECVIVASVKKHDEYKGLKPTTLTRCDIHPVKYCDACAGLIIAKDKKCPTCKKKIKLDIMTDAEMEASCNAVENALANR